MTYYLTEAGANYLNKVELGSSLPNPTGSFEFGGNYTPTEEDYILFSVASNAGGRASRKWLEKEGKYNYSLIDNLLRKGYLTTRKQK